MKIYRHIQKPMENIETCEKYRNIERQTKRKDIEKYRTIWKYIEKYRNI